MFVPPFGALKIASWGSLGALLGAMERLLGPSWRPSIKRRGGPRFPSPLWGHQNRLLGLSWGPLGPLLGALGGRLGGLLGPLLELSWAIMGPS